MSREAENKNANPLETRDDLLQVFQKGGRPPSQFALGLEMEILGVHPKTGEAASFDGEFGIENVLKTLVRMFGWSPVYNDQRLIGLIQGTTAITLEPGGQLELSSSPQVSLQELSNEAQIFATQLKKATNPKALQWVHLGVQPVTPLSKMTWVPKFRYNIMRQYYEKRPGLSLEMMARTASIQANLDYESEADARTKIQIGSWVAPVIAAICANSCIEEAKYNGVMSRRLLIWEETDPDRTGIKPFFVDGSFSFEKYSDYALDIPMYFILRNEKYIDCTGMTFRQFMEGGKKEITPLVSDWISHLTTLFPDVRLKDHLEFRTPDGQPREVALAIMAFWKGLIYNPGAKRVSVDRLRHLKHSDIVESMTDVAYKGLQAKLGKEPILQVARDIVEIATVGLLDEAHFLNPIREILEEGLSPAEKLRKHWDGKIETLLSLSELKFT